VLNRYNPAEKILVDSLKCSHKELVIKVEKVLDLLHLHHINLSLIPPYPLLATIFRCLCEPDYQRYVELTQQDVPPMGS
jgi:hypothetical protein